MFNILEPTEQAQVPLFFSLKPLQNWDREIVINLLQNLPVSPQFSLDANPVGAHHQQKLPNVVYATIHTQGNNAMRKQEQPKLRNFIL